MMRGRSIHARALLRQAGTQSRNAPAIATPTSTSTRGFISSCGPRSARPSSRRVSLSVLSSSKSNSSSTPANGGSSSSSNNSNSAASSSSSASSTSATEKHIGAASASPLVKVKGTASRLAKAGTSPANPPPSSLASVAWENFFSNERPLLQHEMLPPRPKRAGGFGSSTSASGGSLTAIFTSEGTLATFGNFAGESQQQWRRRMRTIAPERFSELIDGLSGVEEQTAAVTTAEEGATRWLVSSFQPESDRVAVESAKLEEEERVREEEEEAVQNALERGEDPEAARKLGAEADLIILGEPHGPSAKWSRGVATYLAEKGRAYEAPPAPVAAADADAATSELLEQFEAPHVANSVFFTDDDPNLMLSHALVQTTLPLALKWDKLVAQMDAVALNDPNQSNKVVDTSILDAQLLGNKRAQKTVKVSPLLEAHNVMMDSVRRKRRKKIRKHKYKKLRKAQRAERQRMKK